MPEGRITIPNEIAQKLKAAEDGLSVRYDASARNLVHHFIDTQILSTRYLRHRRVGFNRRSTGIESSLRTPIQRLLEDISLTRQRGYTFYCNCYNKNNYKHFICERGEKYAI